MVEDITLVLLTLDSVDLTHTRAGGMYAGGERGLADDAGGLGVVTVGVCVGFVPALAALAPAA